jgi:hypothetical protein
VSGLAMLAAHPVGATAEQTAAGMLCPQRGQGRATDRSGTDLLTVVGSLLGVQLPLDPVDELLAAGAGDRFDPGHGRLMREWISLAAATDQATCRMLMAAAP